MPPIRSTRPVTSTVPSCSSARGLKLRTTGNKAISGVSGARERTAQGVKPVPKTTCLDAVEGQMGSLSSRIDDLTSALGQVRELLITWVPATDSTGSVSSAVTRPGAASVSMPPTSAPSPSSEVVTPSEVRWWRMTPCKLWRNT